MLLNLKLVLSLLTLIISLSKTYSISFYHSSDNIQCFYKNFIKGENITMTYMISGENQNTFIVSLKDRVGNKDIFNDIENSSGYINTITENEGEYELCFKPKKVSESSISFEFHSDEEAGHLIKIAKGENLSLMQKDIFSIQSMFEQIEINIKYLTERYSNHSDSKIYIYIFYNI